MIPGDLLSACPHRQFHTLPGLLDSRVAMPNSYPNAWRAMQGGSLYHFYDGPWYDSAGRRTQDLPCKRRTRLVVFYVPSTARLFRDVKLGNYTIPTGNRTPGCSVAVHYAAAKPTVEECNEPPFSETISL